MVTVSWRDVCSGGSSDDIKGPLLRAEWYTVGIVGGLFPVIIGVCAQ